jgi:hypothetical protein
MVSIYSSPGVKEANFGSTTQFFLLKYNQSSIFLQEDPYQQKKLTLATHKSCFKKGKYFYE